MPGGGYLVGGGVQATDYGRGNLLPGAIEGTGKCRECGEDMADGSLAGHRMTQHGRAAESTGEEPLTYHMAFPDKGGPHS